EAGGDLAPSPVSRARIGIAAGGTTEEASPLARPLERLGHVGQGQLIGRFGQAEATPRPSLRAEHAGPRQRMQDLRQVVAWGAGSVRYGAGPHGLTPRCGYAEHGADRLLYG